MFDYTSAAKESDRYAREGGPAYSPSVVLRFNDPVASHRHNEALASLVEPSQPVALPPMPTAAEMAADAARQRGIDYVDEIESRSRFPRKPYLNPHNNPHD